MVCHPEFQIPECFRQAIADYNTPFWYGKTDCGLLNTGFENRIPASLFAVRIALRPQMITTKQN
ncbi:hypothetical protein GCM10011386_12810 [Parapedobacter defluvii]|uniref:Uncharacterized protein n=1 Tax=Parapedobacter defluvii TaxID=2045106 RepID=A0ABQ1LBU8_9SPHI|nr:hypothetical protein GCM10011386_12810 [Parapedobacter defluvii]